MAVFPTARRALSRPARLPWLLAALALLAILFVAPFAAHLLETSHRAQPLPAITAPGDAAGSLSPQTGTFPSQTSSLSAQASSLPSKASSLSPDGEGRGEGGFHPSTASLNTPAVSDSATTPEATAQLAAVLASEAEAYLQLLEATLVEPQTPTASIAEVSEVPARTVVEPVAETSATTTTAAPAESPSAAPTTVVPATDTQPVAEAEVPPPAPVVAPAQPAPVTPAGPVERWAASGIVIATAGQDLDGASLANVDAALSVLPAGVLSSLGNPAFGPLHILVNTSGRVLSGDQPYGGPANFFSTNEATNELVLYPQQSVFTIVHELGHAYNLRRIAAGRYAMVLLDPEMRGFLAATGWQITSTDAEIRSAIDHMHVDYAYTGSFHWPRLSNDDPLEDFANSFAMYFLDPSALQQMSPQRFAWMAATFGH